MTTITNQTPTKESITALILSGGAGRRMGNQDKGWLEYNGISLIERAIDSVKANVENIVLSYNRNEATYGELPYPGTMDHKPGYQGPLMGISSCRHLINSEFTFVMPCDVPTLNESIIHGLAAELLDYELVVAHDGLRLQSLIFLARTQVLDSIDNYLRKGGKSATGWIKTTNHAVVDFSDQKSDFLNINELQQLTMKH